MPRQYGQMCQASAQPLSPQQTRHTQELCVEPVTDAAAVTGAPPTRSSASPRTLRWSQEHWLLQVCGTSRSRAPLCHTTDPRGPPPCRRSFQLLPPPGTAEESPSVRSALSEMPLGNSHRGRASPGIRRRRIRPGMLSHCSGVRVFPEKHPDSWVILGMEAGS